MEDKKILEAYGYDTSNLKEYEEYYIIEPDLIFAKSRLKELRTKPQTRLYQYSGRTMLGEQYRKVPLIHISGSAEADRCFEKAVQAWNGLQSGLQFEYGGMKGVSAQVGNISNETSSFILVEPPLDWHYGSYMKINTEHDFWKYTSEQQHVYAIMHALGHVAGFEHQGSGILINGTTGNNPASIMQNESGIRNNINLWSGFSKEDSTDIYKVYDDQRKSEPLTLTCSPAPAGTDKKRLKYNTRYTFKANFEASECPEPSYEISITKQDAGPGTFKRTNQGNGAVSVEFEPGIYKVRAVVKNMTGTPSTEETYYVTTEKPWVKGPEEIAIGKTYDFYVTYIDPSKPAPEFKVTLRDSYFHDSPGGEFWKVSSGHYQICFSEYGSYTVDFEIENFNAPKQSFRFTKLYKPYYTFHRDWLGPSDSTDPLEQKLCAKYYCRFTFQEDKYIGGSFSVFPHRFVAILRLREARNEIHTAPMQIDHSITTKETKAIVFDAGETISAIQLKRVQTTLAQDFPNTETYYAILEPFYDLIYPVEDFCGIVENSDTVVVAGAEE